MAYAMRPESTLPMIKCSTCGVDIDITSLADHACDAAPRPYGQDQRYIPRALTPGRDPAIQASPYGRQNPYIQEDPYMQSRLQVPQQSPRPRQPHYAQRNGPFDDPRSKAGFLRPGRNAPPRIDPATANRPFLQVDAAVTPESTYSNYSDPRSVTPHTPSTQITSPGSMMSRKPSPPSPEMRLPFDNPFPVFPAEKFRPQSPAPKPATPAQNQSSFPESRFMNAPMSPSAQVLKKMDTIAAGPFGGAAARSQQQTETGPGVSRGTSNGSAQKQFRNEQGREHFRRPSTSQSNRSNRSNPYELSDTAQNTTANEPRQGANAQPSRSIQAVDRFLEQLEDEAGPSPHQILTPSSRSRTLPETSRPLQAGAIPLGDPTMLPTRAPSARSPYAQPLRSAGLERPKYNPYGYDQPQPSPDVFGSVRPRSKSFSSSVNRYNPRRPAEPPVPPVPSVTRQDTDKTTASEPSHSTSSSSSSAYSLASAARSQASTNTSWDISPVKGNASGSRRDWKSRNGSFEENALPAPKLPPILDSPNSPIDPAIQLGIGATPRKRSNTSASTSTTSSSRSTSSRDRDRQQRLHDRSRSQDLPKRTPTTGTSRGPCASCRAPILAGEKSVKDSTARLTGRYHKSCFVCRTCSAPFPTGEFYVHANAPFCARHWHESNGSLCKGCDNGIEGTYLETDRREKFHQGCFRCTTCRDRLEEEYFEFEGKPFCERHSWAFGGGPRGNLGGGAAAGLGMGMGGGGRFGRSPEKRRTRLMNMI